LFFLSFVPSVFISTAVWLLTFPELMKSEFLTSTSYNPRGRIGAVSCQAAFGEYYLKPLCLYFYEKSREN